jgi:LDH2 family malate/lactate/ureidoglycolate dehydrogenase
MPNRPRDRAGLIGDYGWRVTEDELITAAALEAWATAVMVRAGLAPAAAATVAAVLLHASLRGVDSHGIARLPGYVQRMRAGELNLDPRPRVLPGEGALAGVDGDNGPGAVGAVFATDHALALAREHGVGVVVVRRSSHYGAASYYATRVAQRGLIGMAMTNSGPGVVPYGGSEAALGTNPIALAAPLPGGQVWDLDMATRQVALNRIFNARDEGRPIPLGWGVDAAGAATTDPGAARAAVPLGGYKGYALAVMVEVLCGVLSGAGVRGAGDDIGHFHLAIDPERTVGRARVADVLAGLLAELKATPPAAGFEEVRVPGEPEARAQARRERHGIPIEPALHRTLQALGDALHVAFPAA